MTDADESYPSVRGYQVTERLYRGALTEVYRAIRSNDGTPVVLKFQRSSVSPSNKQLYLHNQYAIAQPLAHPHIVRHYSLEPYRSSYALVMEDSGGISLKQYLLAHSLSVRETLASALQLSTALDYLHQNGIVHKDIKPANILIHPETQQVKLIDFSIALQFNRETTPLVAPNHLEGTLAYLSPEQTGRMNRPLDYRSDFYSLGVTLYELLAGRLPFLESDALALVYSHLSRQPPSLTELNPEIPEAIANIVAKLMAKNAENRYQSAAGLSADLQHCWDELTATGTVRDFEIGKLDRIAQLNPSEKLYGREREVQILRAAFERVRQGAAELVAISGYSGIGKTALIREAFVKLAPSNAYLVTGKFEQFKRDIPYGGLIEALRGHIRQLLSGETKTLKYWRDRLQTALGSNGQLLVSVIPELELLLGSQPPAPELAPQEARERFSQTLTSYLLAIASPEYPLVFFMDDIQWIDSPSLVSLQRFFTHPDSRHQLVVIAYRENEVDTTHPLMQQLGKIRESGGKLTTLTLKPLSLTDTAQSLADTLGSTLTFVQPLADLLFGKTGGNPFFLKQLLETLHSEGLLYFDFARECWQWDLESIQRQSASANVVDLMAAKLRKLPPATQAVLQLAACIGNRFDLNCLAAAAQQSPAQTWKSLRDAIQQGSILPLDREYRAFSGAIDVTTSAGDEAPNPQFKFLHDRVQQAAYEPLPSERKQVIHFAIARFLQQKTPELELEARIFEIVNHWNSALALIVEPAERKRIARLNGIAGSKAKASGAYEPALQYFQIGIDLLAPQSLDPDLSRCLQEESAETAYLCGRFAFAEAEIEAILARALTPQERVKAYEIRIQSNIAQHKFPQALQAGREILTLLGVVLPEGDNLEDFARECAEVAALYADRPIVSLIELPPMSDAESIAVVRILGKLWSAAFLSGSPLTPFIVLKQVARSLKYGHRCETPFALAAYGAILLHDLGEEETGYQFGKLALEFLDRFGYRATYTRTAVIVNNFIFPWKEHPRSTLIPLAEAHQIGLETGDIEFASYAAAIYSYHAYFIGQELESLAREMAIYAAKLERLQQLSALAQHNLHYQAVLNLLGRAENPVLPIGEAYDETAAEVLESNNYACIFVFYFNKLVLAYLFEHNWEAWVTAEEAAKYLSSMRQLPYLPVFYFYDSLIRLNLIVEVEDSERAALEEKVAANQKKMQHWAAIAPMNFQHKHDLVIAETCRVSGKIYEAMEYYDRAITGAMENGYIQEAALANELAARCYFNAKKPKIGRVYLQEAYQCYQQWGAVAKIQQLEARYSPWLDAGKLEPSSPLLTLTLSGTSNSSTRSELLDLATIIKATEAISSELLLDRLLARLLSILLENAGAQKGCILLERDGEWFVEVTDDNSSPSGTLVESIPLTQSQNVPLAPLYYAMRTREPLVIANATSDSRWVSDAYVRNRRPLSLLCAPILHQGQLMGLVYLENNLASGVFTRDRLEVIKILMGQAAIALENTSLYQILQQSEVKFRAFVEDVNDVIYSTDLEGNLTYLSPQFKETYGYEIDEYFNRPFVPLVHPDDLEEVMAVHAQIFATGEKHAGLEVRIRHRQGHWVWTVVNSAPIKNPEGQTMGLRGIARDISDRKIAEAALAESEAYHRHLLEQSSIGLALCKMNGELVYANQAYAEIIGRTQAELYSLTYWDVTPQKYAQQEQQQFQIMQALGRYGPYEKEYLHKDGSLIPVRLSGLIVERGGEQFIWSSVENIRDRKRAEAQLQESELFLRSIYEGVNQSICVIEVTPDQDFRFVSWNPLSERNLGISSTEIAGKTLEEVLGPLYDATVRKIYERCLATGESVFHEEFFPLQGQERWWLTTLSPLKDETGRIYRLIASSIDITDRKRAEARLQESELFLRNIYQGVNQGICIVDVTPSKDFSFVSWNPLLEQMTGIPSIEIEGKNPEEVLGPIYGSGVRQHYERCLQANESISYEEFLPLQGRDIWWITTLSPLKDEAGRIYRLIVSVIEITDRKRAERLVQEKNQELERALIQLQESQARVVQSEKMSALGNLIAGVAHEINNPVGFLNGSLSNAREYIQDLLAHVELYQECYPDPVDRVAEDAEKIDLEFLRDDFPKLLDSMQGATDRIKAISKSLRTFSRADTESKVSANLHEGLDSTLLILKYRLKANEYRPAIQVIQEYGELPPIQCFPGQLNQVFMNILANAIDMFDELAQTHSYDDLAAHPQQIVIRTELLDDRVCIHIGDNGKGIERDIQTKIFDRLFTTKAVGKGTGLGLTIAQQIIVEKHGGTISVRSQLEEGTEFEILLPR